MNIAKYKRLKVEIPDVETKAYDKISFSTSMKEGVRLQMLETFLLTLTTKH